MKLKNLFSLLIVSITVLNCQSKVNKSISESNDLCVGSFESTNWSMEIPPEMRATIRDTIEVKGKTYVLVHKYNASVTHAQDLSRCLKSRECLTKELRREYECEREFVRGIHNWVPFAFQGRDKCSIPETECRNKY